MAKEPQDQDLRANGNWQSPEAQRLGQQDPRSDRDRRMEERYGPPMDLPPASARTRAPRDTVTRTIENDSSDRENPNGWSRNTTYSSASGAVLTTYEAGRDGGPVTTYSITLRDSHGHVLSDDVARQVQQELQSGWPMLRMPFSEDQRNYSEGSPLSRAHDQKSHAPGPSRDRGH